jgi:hypothetical protein
MSRAGRLALGIVTCWPLVYMGVFFAIVVSSVAAGGSGRLSHHAFAALFIVHLATTLLIMGLAIFYVVHAWRNVEVDTRALWVIVLILAAPVAMPIYWWSRLWNGVETGNGTDASGIASTTP